ncbi:microtubule-associated serine/threonine-protein kinase 3-like [Ixodes scapularis]
MADTRILILPGGRIKVIDFDTTKVCNGHFTKHPLRGYFRRTPFEFHDGESAGTIPYMAPEILKRRPYGRSADWWSVGIVMYKLMTGRVPFRGKTKQMLRERIITAPLKWPRVEEHKHSATTPAKDMTYRMLKKNPVERLGSVNYNELKTHPFFDRFNWRVLYTNTDLCDIPSIAEILKSNAEKGGKGGDPEDKRRHQRIEEMIDVTNETQKPLLCYSSSSFKKLMTKAVENQSPAQRAQVLPLDVILAVNGVSLADASVDKVNKLVASSADKIVLSVMTSSSYRVLTTQRDALSLVRNAQKETVVLSSAPTSHGGNRPCGLGILDVNVMDDKNKQRVRLFVLTHANVTSKNMKMVYPGDVVTHVDGTSLDVLSRDQVLQLLSTAKKEVTLTVVPLSPMRAKRIIISKFHETAMTDTNVASKSTGANIETS